MHLTRIIRVFFPFWILSCSYLVHASDTTYVPIGAARIQKTVLAFPEIRSKTNLERTLAKNIAEVVTHDLTFMDLFKLLDAAAFVENRATSGITLNSFKFSDWKNIGAEFLIKSALKLEINNTLALEVYLYDTNGAKQLFAKRYLAPQKELKIIAHTLANDIVQSLTQLPGIFLTKIAMSCDATGKKEIYIMNFDGSDIKQVTHHSSIAFAPAWSPDGTRLAYSLFTRDRNNIKNISLYEFNFTTNTVRLLSNRKGINSGAAYSPDGQKLAVTLSFKNNPEIFTLDPRTHSVTQLTKSFGFDVDPAWSPDGQEIAFVSSRTGVPMIFTMDADGKNVKRLTYAGKYNATPTWSPKKTKIGFAGWIDKSFDIFIMNPDGTHIERLSKNEKNEDPAWSPDGNYIVFSSKRTGQKNIYVMNADGTPPVRRLTYGMGECVSPKWSNPPLSGVSNEQK